MRDLVRENQVSVQDLIWPVFVRDGDGVTEPVKSMPGVNRYATDKAVEAFIEAYGGGLHGVRAIGRFRRSEKALRALGTVAEKGGDPGGLAVEYLCSALGSANPKLVECATVELETLEDPDLVDCIIRALDNDTLREPIREVLRRIDTPEARAVLGDQPSDV